MVRSEQATESFAAFDWVNTGANIITGLHQLIAQPRMVPLGVVMLDGRADGILE